MVLKVDYDSIIEEVRSSRVYKNMNFFEREEFDRWVEDFEVRKCLSGEEDYRIMRAFNKKFDCL